MQTMSNILSLAIWVPVAFGLLLLAAGRQENPTAARWIALIGSVVRLFQTGYLYHYALVMILGVFALMTWFVFMQP